jgi:hypothetical protein
MFGSFFLIRLWTIEIPSVSESSIFSKADVAKQSTGHRDNSIVSSTHDDKLHNNVSPKPQRHHPAEATSFKTQTHQRTFQKRYADTPFVKGYRPTGGNLPLDHGDFLQSERMWKFVSDSCLRHDGNDTVPEWQTRAPYAILLGAMKVRNEVRGNLKPKYSFKNDSEEMLQIYGLESLNKFVLTRISTFTVSESFDKMLFILVVRQPLLSTHKVFLLFCFP